MSINVVGWVEGMIGVVWVNSVYLQGGQHQLARDAAKTAMQQHASCSAFTRLTTEDIHSSWGQDQ